MTFKIKEVCMNTKCNCGQSFNFTWTEGSQFDWSCPECGRRLGIDKMKVQQEEL